MAVPSSDATIKALLDAAAHRNGDGTHLIDPTSGTRLSYRESHAKITAMASAISSYGVPAGAPVAYAFSNSIHGALTILSLLYGGYLATAVNLVAGSSTIDYVLDHSGAALIIADEDGAALVRAAATGPLPQIILIDDLMNAPATALSDDAPDASRPSLLMYTSGTTGRPKGVVHTQSSLICGGQNTAIAHQLSAQDCGLCVLPFYHINAFCVSLMGTLVSGGALVVPPRFSVSSFWEVIRAHACTWFSVVPTQISYLLHNADQPNGSADGTDALRFGRSASAPLSPDVHAAFEQKFGIPIIETMGLTETAAQILSNPMPPGICKIGSPGIAFGNEVIIGTPDQVECPRGEEGEILVRGPNVLKEYLKNPDATSEAITKDGWLRTGDLGRMDEDGYVYVTGRLKELIIKGGENIAPREVDEALYSHPDVIEAAAFGVDCDQYGQRVEAGVKLCEGSSLDEDQLIAFCRDKLGAFKLPDRVYILADLPKGPSGKIQRIKIAELVGA